MPIPNMYDAVLAAGMRADGQKFASGAQTAGSEESWTDSADALSAGGKPAKAVLRIAGRLTGADAAR